MSDNSVVITEDSPRVFRLTWYLLDEDRYGDNLGYGEEDFTLDDVEATEDPDDFTFRMAEYAASRTKGVERDDEGYFWTSKKSATAALEEVEEAMEAEPWPAWARKAKSEGWVPPSGWRP